MIAQARAPDIRIGRLSGYGISPDLPQILETPVTCAAGALEPGERHERNSPSVIDVRARDADRAVSRQLLGDLERMLRAGRADRNHHDAVRRHLLQKWRRDMVDGAGDDDLVEGSLLLPAVITVGVFGRDRLVLVIAALNQGIVKPAGALRQRLDDLDRPNLVGQIGEIGRLVSGTGSDL